MVRKLFKLFLFALTLPVSAGLNPADYDRWQAYNNWPIRVLEFPGIHSFSRAELITVMATEKPAWSRRYIRLGHRTTFFADDFAADVLRVQRFYRREGFPDADVTGYVHADEVRRELRLQMEISEGAPMLISAWRFDSADMGHARVDSLRWSRSMSVAVGDRLALSAIRAAADTVAYELKKFGFARATVDTRLTVDSLLQQGEVVFVPHPGSYCRLGVTRVTGLKQVTEGTARRELTFAEYEPFSPEKLERTRRNLVRLETFRFVAVRADTSVAGDTLPVHIAVEEGNRYRVRLGLGYNYPQQARVDGEFTDLNFFGRGRRFALNAGASVRLREVSARLFWPHTPWNGTDLTLSPAWRLRDEELGKIEEQLATTIFSLNASATTHISLSNEVGRKNRLDAPDSVDAAYFSSVESFSFGWDTRDNPLIPRRGHFIGLTVQESGAFYPTDRRWWKAILQTRVLVPSGRHRVFAWKFEGGVMGPLYQDAVTPQDVRFALGGPATVRGWGFQRLSPRGEQDADVVIGGDAMLNVTAEVRQGVWGPVTLAAFCDAGNVWVSRTRVRPFDVYPSAGGGIQFLTPVGPLRLDLATQLRLSGQPHSIQILSVSFGTPF